MDPISQASFGASLSQSFANNGSKQAIALLIGALAGMAPDLDILINSAEDPILFLEFHRQFTHSLMFIPLGALICALVFYPLLHSTWMQGRWPAVDTVLRPDLPVLPSLGYATHGLLDACTSYGTQLFWPFSNERFAWNIVSIIDPLFTLPVIFFIIAGRVSQECPLCADRFYICSGFLKPWPGAISASRAGGPGVSRTARPPGGADASEAQFC